MASQGRPGQNAETRRLQLVRIPRPSARPGAATPGLTTRSAHKKLVKRHLSSRLNLKTSKLTEVNQRTVGLGKDTLPRAPPSAIELRQSTLHREEFFEHSRLNSQSARAWQRSTFNSEPHAFCKYTSRPMPISPLPRPFSHTDVNHFTARHTKRIQNRMTTLELIRQQFHTAKSRANHRATALTTQQ